MDQETGLLATIRDTPPLEAGTRKARSVLDCQQKKKRGWPIVGLLCVYERYSLLWLYIKCIQITQYTEYKL